MALSSHNNQDSFLKSGHLPTLIGAFLYFDFSFMVWVLLGPLAVQIAADLNFNNAEKGLMVATPVLAAAILRFLMGFVVDRIKPKAAGILAQLIVIMALLAAWQFGIHNMHQAQLLGIFLGLAGASFVVAIPMVSSWYPPQHQGKALGIAGAGNSGSVLSALFAPLLATYFGWQATFAFAAIPMVLVLVYFVLFTKNAPSQPAPKTLAQYGAVLRDKDAWWFMSFYLITFGGFVGLASSLTIYFNTQYGMQPIYAGYFTAGCVFVGSICRTMGGFAADRFGGVRTLNVVYVLISVLLVAVSFTPSTQWHALAFFLAIMGVMGVGNGSVFQLIPQRFTKEMSVITGLVGMAGGAGGFYMAYSLGLIKQHTGSYQMGLVIFASFCLVALYGLNSVKKRWRTTWGASSVTNAKI